MKYLITVILLVCSLVASAIEPIKNIEPNITSIPRIEVYWIYTMKTRFWSDGSKITVFYSGFDSPTHVSFVKQTLGISPQQFQSAITTYVNSGNASYFRVVRSDFDMLRQVAITPGSVGYISSKTLLINGGYNDIKKIDIID